MTVAFERGVNVDVGELNVVSRVVVTTECDTGDSLVRVGAMDGVKEVTGTL